MKLSSVGVFCGSASGVDPAYSRAATAAGLALAERSLSLIYGGGKVGLMGAVADATLQARGHAVGVMPKHLVDKEIAHTGLSELFVVETMHERKLKMSELSAGFLVLPGGAGTMEEAFEQWTWAQIGIHSKPIGFVNVKGFFDPLISMTDEMIRAGFLDASFKDMLIIDSNPENVIQKFFTYSPPPSKTYEFNGVKASPT